VKKKTVQNLIDKHKGKVGFVVGAGPSLRHLSQEDVEIMGQGIVFAVNSALPKVPFADYFIADDIGVKNWRYYSQLLPMLDTHALLYENKLGDHANHLPEDRITWFKHKWWFDPKNKSYNPDGLAMTKGGPIIGARTTAGSAVHFAYLMGCDPIVLLGCDCCYEGMKRYYWQFDGEKKCKRTTGEPVFSMPNRGIHRDKPVDAHCMSFLDYWEALAKQADAQGIKIYDASEGILDCFEKINMGELDVL